MEYEKLRIDLFEGSRPAEKVLVLEGVLNADTAFRLRDFVRQHAPETLVIDMTRVRSLDSSGLGC
jgi:anti-anti-sigma regulatory factor